MIHAQALRVHDGPGFSPKTTIEDISTQHARLEACSPLCPPQHVECCLVGNDLADLKPQDGVQAGVQLQRHTGGGGVVAAAEEQLDNLGEDLANATGDILHGRCPK